MKVKVPGASRSYSELLDGTVAILWRKKPRLRLQLA